MHADHSALFLNLALATAMVAITVLIHFWGLIALVRVMGHTRRRLGSDDNIMGQAALLVLVVFGLVGLHTIEIWLYAVLYVALGALHTFEESLYFSTVTFVTLGYGDVVLGKAWRLLSAIEPVLSGRCCSRQDWQATASRGATQSALRVEGGLT